MSELISSSREPLKTVLSNHRDRNAVAVYVGALMVLGGVLSIQAWQGGFGTDAYAHLAVFRELSAHPFEPMNPYVSAADPAHYFSPYSVGLGIVGWLSAAEPVTLLLLGSAINLSLLGIGLWLFSRVFSPHRWTPHLVLFYTLFAWGFFGWRSSGFFHFGVIGAGLGYPSIFASGLALVALAGLCSYFSTRRMAMPRRAAIAAAVITLTHLFTAMWTAIAALAIVASQPIGGLRRVAVGLVGLGLIAAALVLVWPYYSIIEVATEASARSAVHADLYRHVFMRSFLFIPGVVAVGHRALKNRRDPLVLMFVVSVTIFIVGYMAPSYGLGRIIPLIALSTHVALAVTGPR